MNFTPDWKEYYAKLLAKAIVTKTKGDSGTVMIIYEETLGDMHVQFQHGSYTTKIFEQIEDILKGVWVLKKDPYFHVVEGDSGLVGCSMIFKEANPRTSND